MDENLRKEVKEEILNFLPYLRATLDAYKEFEKSLREYKSFSGEELYKNSPILIKLLIKLFESGVEDLLKLE